MMTSSPDWNALVAEQDQSRRIDLLRSIGSTLQPADIETLTSVLKTGSEHEKHASLGLLMVAVRRADPPVTPRQRLAMVEQLDPLLPDYPRGNGLQAFYLLRLLDPVRAEEFLVTIVRYDDLAIADFSTAISNLILFSPSSRTTSRLRELSHLPGKAGQLAEGQLDNLGLINEAKLQAIAVEWRRTKSREPLNRLFEVFILHQGAKPIEPILALLGPPSHHEDSRSFWYHSSDGVTLYLEADEQRRLKAMKIT